MKLHANARTCFHCRSLIVSWVIDDDRAPNAIAAEFRVSPRTVHKWVKRFRTHGIDGLRDRSSRPHRVARRYLQPGKELHDAVFSVLHCPPSAIGLNRTTWKLDDLAKVLREKGIVTTLKSINEVIKNAGYRWKKARVSLTSTDPEYKEKVEVIRSTLAGLRDDEAFFSIDEFWPIRHKDARRQILAGSERDESCSAMAGVEGNFDRNGSLGAFTQSDATFLFGKQEYHRDD